MKFSASLVLLVPYLALSVSAAALPHDARQFGKGGFGKGGFGGNKGGNAAAKGGNAAAKGGNAAAQGGAAAAGAAAAKGGKGGNAAKGAAAGAAGGAAAAAGGAAAAGAANSTAAAAGKGANNAAGSGGDLQTSLNLDPSLIGANLAQTGLGVNGSEAGQVASDTSTNNFINFCAAQKGLPITNGLQIPTGSCNPVPMGNILAKTAMPSSKFSNPKNMDVIAPNTAFTISMSVANMETGNFVNPNVNYFAAPQKTNAQGQLVAHSHVVVEAVNGLTDTKVTDPTKFAFFKGLNAPAQGGVLTADVTNGLPEGTYRLASINTASNHQPALVAVAQHGSLDDMVYFTVSANGAGTNGAAAAAAGGAAASNSTAAAGGAAAAKGAAAGAAGAAAGAAAGKGAANAGAAKGGAAAAKGGANNAAAGGAGASKGAGAAKGGAAAAGAAKGAAGAGAAKGGAGAKGKGGKRSFIVADY